MPCSCKEPKLTPSFSDIINRKVLKQKAFVLSFEITLPSLIEFEFQNWLKCWFRHAPLLWYMRRKTDRRAVQRCVNKWWDRFSSGWDSHNLYLGYYMTDSLEESFRDLETCRVAVLVFQNYSLRFAHIATAAEHALVLMCSKNQGKSSTFTMSAR